ncbi:MAG: S41 family peptidase [candidate division Zixibacteria bacterium]|nr:S41 family peptidase [candidate division Zixibacteria bacterium]
MIKLNGAGGMGAKLGGVMKDGRKFGAIAVVLTVICLTAIWIIGMGEAVEKKEGQAEEYSSIFGYAKLFDMAALEISSKYVEDIDPKKIVYSGIKGMLGELDPFSSLQDKEAHERFIEITQGKYEGLGMAIGMRNGFIIVSSTFEGSPAYRKGIRPGDKILEIDGKSTQGMNTEDASQLMRGASGTTVKLQIKREGLETPLEYEIERAIIELKNVPYYGVVEDSIGYIRLSRFSEDSGKELREAITDLNQRKIKGLILDLRNNGGGLLSQAVETSEMLLDKGKLVVYTKGRDEKQTIKYLAQAAPILPDKPLVVLVDEGTASASEIVAGAVQDWDRGVIIGNNTYGKGLVQQIFDLPMNAYIKLTVAKYYIPSGRCIQKPEMKNGANVVVDEQGQIQKLEQKEKFYTKGGRLVFGEGGIAPDIQVEEEKLSPIQINLERKAAFFDFAVRYIGNHPDLPPNLEVDQKMLDDFKEFLKEINFTYQSPLEMELESLKKSIQEENVDTGFGSVLANLENLVKKEKEKDFERSSDDIKNSIKRDILFNLYGEKAYYEQILLKTDPYIKKGVEVLKDKKEYEKLLKS